MTQDQPGAPGEDRTIDLDAARAARAEKRGPSPSVKVNGEIHELPAELPAEAVHAFGALMRGDPSGLELGMRSLFGDAWDRITKGTFSLDDEIFLLENALELYGISLPESEASAPS